MQLRSSLVYSYVTQSFQPSKIPMYINISVPATLPLALVKLEEGGRDRLCLLAAALSHPPIQLSAQVAQSFTITGPRADIAGLYARHLYELAKPEQLIEIEINHAIPVAMGLGSGTLMGLSMAWALSHFNWPAATDVLSLHGQLGDETNGLGLWASQYGGLMLLDLTDPTAPPLYRAEPDTTDKDAWGIVYVIPRLPDTLDEDEMELLEGERFDRLAEAADALDSSSGFLFTKTIWPGVEANDLDAFCAGLAELQHLTAAAMTSVGIPALQTEKELAILEQMQASGGGACSQSLTGHALYAFARGAKATIDMRVDLRMVVSHVDGQMNAAHIDDKGIQVEEKGGSMKEPGSSLDRL